MKRKPSLASQNKKLIAQNSALSKKASLLESTINNSLTDLASALGGGGIGFPQSNLTSLNPTLVNNIYAPVTLMWQNLMFMYKTHGLIQTMIDMPVLDALRGGLDLTSDQLSNEDLSELEDRLEEDGVLDRVGDAMIWARLFGGGALIINTEAEGTEPLGEEIEEGGKIELYDAARWELDCSRRLPQNGEYGFYGQRLHESRVLTLLGKRAPYLIRAQLSDWGMSELERVIEDFNLFLRGREVVYAILDEAKLDVYQLEGFTAQLATAQGTNLTARRIQTMNQIKNFNNALLLDAKDKYEQKQLSFGGLADILKENRIGIASALRMPMAKLFGLGSSGFSSGEDDIENYNALVESEVRNPLRSPIRKLLKLYIRSVFGEDLDIKFEFKPLRILNAVDEENIKASRSTRYLNLFDRLLANSREVGEAIQKDNLFPVPLEAEKGLLDDHPMPEMGQPNVPAEDLGEGGVKKKGDKEDEEDDDKKEEKEEPPAPPAKAAKVPAAKGAKAAKAKAS